MQFSHLSVEPTRSGAAAGHMAHENLFREPEPTLEAATTAEEPALQHDVAARPQRTTRRRTAA